MINNVKVYRASNFEKFACKFFPHLIPFISKRKRVRIRNYFKWAYRRRLMKDMVDVLGELYAKTSPLEKMEFGKIEFENYEWEVLS